MLQKITPDRVIRFEYDNAGRLSAAKTYAKNLSDDILLTQPLPGKDLLKQNPLLALQLMAEVPETNISFERDALGRLIQESQNGRSVDSSYNPLGQRDQRVTASGHESLWAYDPNGLPSNGWPKTRRWVSWPSALRRNWNCSSLPRVSSLGWQDRPHRFAGAGEGFNILQEFDQQGRQHPLQIRQRRQIDRTHRRPTLAKPRPRGWA